MQQIEIVEGDITRLDVQAIVNAANERMLGGGGVDGAIHRAAGPGLLEECRAVEEVRPGIRCPTGEARITGGYDLPAKYVIHTVGPIWRGGERGEPEELASCYRESLRLAIEHEVWTIAFPAISCGVYGYPSEQAAKIAIRTIAEVLPTRGGVLLDRVLLVAFGEGMRRILEGALAEARQSSSASKP